VKLDTGVMYWIDEGFSLELPSFQVWSINYASVSPQWVSLGASQNCYCQFKDIHLLFILPSYHGNHCADY